MSEIDLAAEQRDMKRRCAEVASSPLGANESRRQAGERRGRRPAHVHQRRDHGDIRRAAVAGRSECAQRDYALADSE